MPGSATDRHSMLKLWPSGDSHLNAKRRATDVSARGTTPRYAEHFMRMLCSRLLPYVALSVSVFAADHSPAVNQTIISAIPERIKSFVADNTITGAVTLVGHGNDVVEFDASGMADIEANVPMQKDTIFQIMS